MLSLVEGKSAFLKTVDLMISVVPSDLYIQYGDIMRKMVQGTKKMESLLSPGALWPSVPLRRRVISLHPQWPALEYSHARFPMVMRTATESTHKECLPQAIHPFPVPSIRTTPHPHKAGSNKPVPPGRGKKKCIDARESLQRGGRMTIQTASDLCPALVVLMSMQRPTLG